MKNLIIIILILFVSFIGCKKENKTIDYTISGTLYLDCNTPLANASLEIFQHAVLLSNNGTIGTVTTDANGHFTFSYNAQSDASSPIGILTNLGGISPVKIIDNLPPNQNVVNFVCTYKALSYRVYQVLTSNPLTSNDTLYVGLSPTSYTFHIGPFSNNALFDSIATSIPYSLDYLTLNSPTIKLQISWGLGKTDFNKSCNVSNNFHVIKYDHDRTCGKYNIVTIPIN